MSHIISKKEVLSASLCVIYFLRTINKGENITMKNTLENDELFNCLISESSKRFEGWDFSYLESTGRMQSFPLRWNYRSKVKIRMRGISSLLDMGTG